ncbi:hypothetical protein AMS68_002100 [Peltaster fructicola]|uniref:Uncharacterized protein n=1 Tax=Peltaster fructicola TaxID=286661 RepID=A0A6H0XPD9_9PEZI|nr:hypothetical protein AMS68_002100 [Peltaster fructicola]
MAHTHSELSSELTAAIKMDNIEEVQRLTHTSNTSMIELAAASNATKVMGYLISRGGEVSDCTMKALSDNSSWDTHRYLVECDAVDVNHHVPWIGDMISSAIQDGNAEHVKFLLDHGADPLLHRYDEAWTNLAGAASTGRADIVEMLLPYPWKQSGALPAAADEGHVEIVQLLLSHGFDINEVGIIVEDHELSRPKAGTALHKAVQRDDVVLIKVLLEAGADRGVKDGKGRTVDELAREKGNSRVLQVLGAAA